MLALHWGGGPTADNYPTHTGMLRVRIDNVRAAQGVIWVGIYPSRESFLVKEKAILVQAQVSATGTVEVLTPDLPYGEYALALFHDLNNNGELDLNWAGIPTEPYAFAKAPPSRWRLPYFEEVAFVFTPQRSFLSTRLRTWWD